LSYWIIWNCFFVSLRIRCEFKSRSLVDCSVRILQIWPIIQLYLYICLNCEELICLLHSSFFSCRNQCSCWQWRPEQTAESIVKRSSEIE
jgi:hypothetical protein